MIAQLDDPIQQISGLLEKGIADLEQAATEVERLAAENDRLRAIVAERDREIDLLLAALDRA